MKRIASSHLLLIALLCGLLSTCRNAFLDVQPNGSLDEAVLAAPEGIDALLIGAYAMLDGVSSQGFGWEAAASNWVFCSVRSMEANKGSDAGDASEISPIQNFSEVPENAYLNARWRSLYEGVARCNSTLLVVGNATEKGAITPEQADLYSRQARALRGHYHFEAWKMWKMIPYVDETTDPAAATNTVDIRSRIIADLEAGTGLPANMGQIGRFNRTVATVILAKAEMQLNGNYEKAKGLLQSVVASGTKPDGSPIGLEPRYGDIFDIEFRNGLEAIYTVQYSVNDGSGGWNGGWGEVLNFPYQSGASPGGCCGFFQPTQEFVNSFRTVNGLPLLDFSYNDLPVWSDQGVSSDDPSFIEDPGPVDPRLDWTVGRRGIPYLDWGEHRGMDWIRDQSYAGPYSPKKQVYKKSQEGRYTEVGSWTAGFTANGYRLIRYADVLLLLAECQAETGHLADALENVNKVRDRAANSDGFVTEADGATPAAHYQIAPYTAFPNVDYARRAIRMERKLELGMEGHRFFDLQRWGACQEEINRILNYERALFPAQYSRNAYFGPEDALYPIPQRQIDLSNGNLVQNR